MTRVAVAGSASGDQPRLLELFDTDGLDPIAIAGVEDLGRLRPHDVLVICDRFDGVDPAAVMAQVLHRQARALVLSVLPLDRSGSEYLLAGASGYLMLDELGPGELRAAVETVAAGESALHPAVALQVLEQWRRHRAEAVPARPVLTAREGEILEGIRAGLTTRLMARRLGVAEKTVEAHRSRLYAKLGARNRADVLELVGWMDAPAEASPGPDGPERANGPSTGVDGPSAAGVRRR